jgi:hypothetical protein
MIEADDQHSRFLKRLDASRPSVFRVAEWLHRRGFTVKIPSMTYAKDASEHSQHVDDGDLFIKKPSDDKWMRVEVKQINSDFEGKETWPFSGMFVSNKRAVDRADPVPVSYITVSKSMSHGGIVYTKTKNQWSEANIVAKNTGNIETFYVCSLNFVKFIDLRK